MSSGKRNAEETQIRRGTDANGIRDESIDQLVTVSRGYCFGKYI